MVQHRTARLSLGRADQAADLLPLLYIVDQVQRGVVHLVIFVHLEHTLNNTGEGIYNIAVLAVKGGLPPCQQKQVEIPVFIVSQPVRQTGIHPIDDTLCPHRLIEQIPGQLLSLLRRRKYQYPGV